MVNVSDSSNKTSEKLPIAKHEKSPSDRSTNFINNKPSKNIMSLAGVWSDNADEWKKIEEKISSDRKKIRLRTIN